MRSALAAMLLAGSIGVAAAQAPVTPAPLPAGVGPAIAAAKARALASDLSFDLLRELVTEVGPRPTGWEGEARARDWAVAKLKALGFTNVHVEPFTVPAWRRISERFEITAPFRQPLVGVALGWSAPTPAGGVEAEIVRFADLAALRAAPAGSLAGKIAFVDEKMARTQDGASYGYANPKRRQASQIAREKGALAALIRTVGTNPDRVANTGSASPAGTLTPIAAAAISNPDSDQLARLLAKGPVRVRMDVSVETRENAQSGNVVAEIKGREKPSEIVLLGAHLDSWDITPGAQDDGAGVTTMIAAAQAVQALKPKRTIRVVLYGAEEVGELGGIEYARAHKAELAAHIAATESDFGAGPAYRLRTSFADPAKAAALAAQLGDLAIITDSAPAHGASDVGHVVEAGVPAVDISTDGYLYFDIHHTPVDTVEKVDRDAMRKNVAAWAAFAAFASETGWDFRAKP